MKTNLLKLNSRSRFLLIVLFFLGVTLIYYRNFYLPRAMSLSDARERYTALKEEHERLKSTMPDIAAEQRKIEDMKRAYDNMTLQIIKAEKILPKNVNIPDILKYLVQDKDEYRLKIVTIKSRKDKAQDVPLYVPPPDSKQKTVSYYNILPIELEMFGSFDDIIGYIGNIEKRFPYQRIGGLQIDMQKTSGGQPECYLTVLSVLGRGEEKDVDYKEFQLALEKAGSLKSAQDPFHKTERPRLEERLAGMELNGIIWKKGTPYAIINGTTYKVDDTVQNKKIIKIEKETVMLEEEDRLFKLTLKKE